MIRRSPARHYLLCARYHAARLASAAGLARRSAVATPFIVLGRGRTGSNLLCSLLNSHGRAMAFGELFRADDYIGWDYPGFRSRSPRALADRQRDPVQFLRAAVFERQPGYIAASGFKIFYQHAGAPEVSPVWQYLLGRTDTRVIHMKRRNYLRVELSRRRAMHSGEWINTGKGRGRTPAVQLDPVECERAFEATRRKEQRYAALFDGHPLIDVAYEDLESGTDDVMAGVQAHLELPVRSLATRTIRQGRGLLSDAIANYGELRAHFQDSEWGRFFDE